MNVDENSDLAIKYDVQTIPRIMFFKGGETPVQTHVGTMSEADLTKLINAMA